MTRTSHKKNRPFDFKLISLVQPNPVLYHRHWGGLSTFECMKEKTRIWNEIAAKMETTPDFCLSRWNNLKNHFQRELRHCYELCPKEGIIRGSTWPYLKCMSFVEGSVKCKIFDKARRSSKRDQSDLAMRRVGVATKRAYVAKTNDNVERNDCFVEMEELTEDIIGNALPTPDESIQERLTSFEQMSVLLHKIPSDSKVQIEERIMTYLCKCQLRALVNEGIDDLMI